MTTGERIRQARKSAGMTQAELAHKLGISAAGIAQWENDLRNPKIETLRKLADALGVTPGYLLYGDTDPVQRSLFDAEDTAKALKGELQKSLETGKITPALTNGKAAKALSVLENQMWTAVDEIGKESGSALLQLFRFLPPDLRDIVVYYEELNADGQRVARERIEELTQIYKYQREEKHPPENAQGRPARRWYHGSYNILLCLLFGREGRFPAGGAASGGESKIQSFLFPQALIALGGPQGAHRLERLHHQHQQHHADDHDIGLGAVVAVGQGDLAQTAAADDAGHGGVAQNGGQCGGHAGDQPGQALRDHAPPLQSGVLWKRLMGFSVITKIFSAK